MVDHRSDVASATRAERRPGGSLVPAPGDGSAGRRVAPLVLWMVCLGLGIVLFHAIGTGRLAPPPLAPSEWSGWADGRDPLIATVAVLRLLVLGLAWYLVGATSIGLIARLLRAARFVRLADALSVPMVRRLVQGAVGLTMATAVVSASTPAVGAAPAEDRGSLSLAAEVERDDPDTSATMTLVNDGRAEEAGQSRPRPDGGELTLRGEGGSPAADGSAAAASDALTLRPSVSETDEVAEGEVIDGEVREHEVRAGESFWSIAATMVAVHLDRQPTEAEVRGYWRTLVAANQDRLAVEGDADLIFPGQRFVMPSVEGMPDPGGEGS